MNAKKSNCNSDSLIKHFQKHHSRIVVNQKELNKKFGSSMKDFMILAELGRGSFGLVYKVQSLWDNSREYVLK